MADFSSTDLRGSSFDRVDLRGARLRSCDLSGSRFDSVDLHGAVLRGVELVDVEIDGLLQNVTVNGVDVAPLVEAELDRRDPDRALMRPTDADGFRDGLGRRRAAVGGRPSSAPAGSPEQLHESVDGEWSFIETLRHLVFATDAWVRRRRAGRPGALATRWTCPGTRCPTPRACRGTARCGRRWTRCWPCGRPDGRPSRQVLDGLTDERLGRDTEPVDATGGWPPPSGCPVPRCLLRRAGRGVGAPPLRRARPRRPGSARARPGG